MNYLATFSILLLGISCSNITAANYASIPSSSSSYSFRRAFSINGAIGTSITHTNHWRGKNNNNAAYTRSSRSRRQQRQQYTPPLAVVVTPVMRNLARGSILKCLADLTGGLPLEVWKSVSHTYIFHYSFPITMRNDTYKSRVFKISRGTH